MLGWLFAGQRSAPCSFLSVVMARRHIAHILTLADGTIVGMATEALTRGVHLLSLYLALHITRGGEADNTLGWNGVFHLDIATVVQILVLGALDNGKGAKALDGHTLIVALAELVAYLVEHMRKQCLDRWTGEATTLHYVGSQFFKIFLWLHTFYIEH